MAALINGNAYTFAGAIISIGGVKVTGVNSFNWQATRVKVDNYGTGTEPVSRGYGIQEYTASLELSQVEIKALRASSTTGSLLDIPPFDITVLLRNGVEIITHVWRNSEFINDGVSASLGDTQLLQTLDILTSNVETT